MNPFNTIGLPDIINGAGKMTYLGSSVLAPQVVEVMGQAAQNYVDMEAMKPTVGCLAARLMGGEYGCVTACCAAGIAVSVASVLTRTDLYKVESLPDVHWMPKKIVIQKGHMVNFGANISQAIAITGAQIQEIGTVNATKLYHLEAALEEAAAVIYVVSHHAVFNGMLTLEETIESAHQRGVPVIVDAAAETDFEKYVKSGADLVVFSGHKAIGGPTSGIIVGNKERIAACQLQDKGIARMMKVGKENIMGVYAALKYHIQVSEDQRADQYKRRSKQLKGLLEAVPGIDVSIGWDGTRPIPRVLLKVGKASKYTAKQLIDRLESGDPSIRTRNHLADEGIIQFDPRELKEEELPVIAARLQEIMGEDQEG